MADSDTRKRILDMLAAGRITADAAAELLKAVSTSGPRLPSPPPVPTPPPAPQRGGARMLRILVDAPHTGNGGKVRVNVPLALAKYAMRFIPRDTTEELSDQGIDLAQLLQNLGDDLPQGRLVDIEAEDDSGDAKIAVIVEVV